MLSALLALGIWLLSSGGSTPLPAPHPLDWLAHLLTYMALSFCLSRATGNPVLALLLAAWFGALDEVHQAFVPPREAGITDWWFDLAGSLLGSRLAVGRALPLAPQPQPVALPSDAPLLDMQFDEQVGKS